MLKKLTRKKKFAFFSIGAMLDRSSYLIDQALHQKIIEFIDRSAIVN